MAGDLPEGLQTEVGERGSRLSMGQRQLVALMRVLVQKPAIFILDEATASIDPFTEWQIQQALNLILERTTSILIAHRLSTVKAADRIIVMGEGRIMRRAATNGLLAQGGHYATLYNTYFRHQSLAYVEQMKDLVERDVTRISEVSKTSDVCNHPTCRIFGYLIWLFDSWFLHNPIPLNTQLFHRQIKMAQGDAHVHALQVEDS